ncbi:MAG: CotH kinase family protein [Chthoniobacteraceae bacterium]
MRTNHLARVVIILLFESPMVMLAQDRARPESGVGGEATDIGPSDRNERSLSLREKFAPPLRKKLLVAQFDAAGDGRLNAAERKAAREYPAQARALRVGAKNPITKSVSPGPVADANVRLAAQASSILTPEDVKWHPDTPLYDLRILRTVFIEFENLDWEEELEYFYNTDVEVSAKLTVDGQTYEDVGVHFRGMSSFTMAGKGCKRSLNLSLNFVHQNQRLGGYRTLNLLNSAGDPTLLRTVLYSQIAREYIPAPKANWVRVVINGENWGIYVNAQQFNTDFVQEWFGTKKGARWKAPGSPAGQSGLEYLGEDVAPYRTRFEIRSEDDAESWRALIELCRVLNETPPDRLVEKLAPMLDLEGTLRYLALDNVFINSDGYWIRASDFSLYRDTHRCFHPIPHDVNETFYECSERGSRLQSTPGSAVVFVLPKNSNASPTVGGVDLDPLAGADDPRKPLLSKLLAVPELRERYLSLVREIAAQWLDWEKLGPLARQYHSLLAEDMKTATHELASYDAFAKGLEGDGPDPGIGGFHRTISLRRFGEQRRAFLFDRLETLEAHSEPLAR